MYFGFVSNWSLFGNSVHHHDVSTTALRVLWTIGVEEQFYLLFPFAFIISLRASLRGKLALVTSIAAFSFGWKVLLYLIGALYFKNPSLGIDFIYFSTFSYFDILVASAVAGWIAAEGSIPMDPSETQETFAHRLLAYLKTSSASVLIVVLLTASVFLWKLSSHNHHTALMPLSISLMGIAFPLAILWLFANHNSFAARILGMPLLRTIGVLSFGIYVWHSVGDTIVNCLIPEPKLPGGRTFDIIVTLKFSTFVCVAVLLSLLSYRLIELPALALRARLHGDDSVPQMPFNYTRWLTGVGALALVLPIVAKYLATHGQM